MALYDNKSIGERITQFRDKLGLNKTEFGEPAGLTQAHIYQLEIGRNKKILDKLEAIFIAYPLLNREWLLYGEGDMLDPNKNSPSVKRLDDKDIIIDKLTKEVNKLKDEIIELYRKNAK